MFYNKQHEVCYKDSGIFQEITEKSPSEMREYPLVTRTKKVVPNQNVQELEVHLPQCAKLSKTQTE